MLWMMYEHSITPGLNSKKKSVSREALEQPAYSSFNNPAGFEIRSKDIRKCPLVSIWAGCNYRLTSKKGMFY